MSLPRLRAGLFQEALATGSRGSAGNTWSRLGSKLVVLELAAAMVLLVGAGLLGKSFYRLLQVDIGLQPDHLATLQVAAPQAGYAMTNRPLRSLARWSAGSKASLALKPQASAASCP
jgi:hypothetical protein